MILSEAIEVAIFHAVKSVTESKMRVVCSWCCKEMGNKPGPFGTTSHGICPACDKALNDELDRCAGHGAKE